MAKRLIPLLDRVLVERLKPVNKSIGGVLLPDTATHKVWLPEVERKHYIITFCAFAGPSISFSGINTLRSSVFGVMTASAFRGHIYDSGLKASPAYRDESGCVRWRCYGDTALILWRHGACQSLCLLVFSERRAGAQMSEGLVVATGPGRRNLQNGELIPVNVSEGQKVLLPEYGGQPIKLEDKE